MLLFDCSNKCVQIFTQVKCAASIYIIGTVPRKLPLAFIYKINVINSLAFESLITSKRLTHRLLFPTLLTTPILYNTFWDLELSLCQYCNVRYPTVGLKPNITVIKSLQIRFRGRGPIPNDLFCSLIFISSVKAIQLN